MAATSGETRSRTWPANTRQALWKLSDRLRQLSERRRLTAEAALGRKGEDLAHRYLRSSGYQVVARNYRPGSDSEIDIVARHAGKLVFVEVKSRSSADYGSPDRAIDIEKQRHIVRAARSFITRSGDAWSTVRFDTVAIVFSEPPAISHYSDVFFEGRALD